MLRGGLKLIGCVSVVALSSSFHICHTDGTSADAPLCKPTNMYSPWYDGTSYHNTPLQKPQISPQINSKSLSRGLMPVGEPGRGRCSP